VSTRSLGELSGMPSALLGAEHRERRPDLADRLRHWIADQSPDGVAWSQRAMAARPDRTDVLRSYDGPAAVVVGVQDEITPVAAAEHLVAALSDAELVVVPGAGHMTSIEAPGLVAAALARLLERVDAHH
jgi:pimeloyl-ACP methyl ester carboxylesterase